MKDAENRGAAHRRMRAETACNMADALTYLSRVATEAGYNSIACDILVVRDKLALMALAERRERAGRTESQAVSAAHEPLDTSSPL
jgi:hypothetical protein